MSTRSRRSTAVDSEAQAPSTPAAPQSQFACTWEGCTHGSFKTHRGLMIHIKTAHEAAQDKEQPATEPGDPALEQESEEPTQTPKVEKKKTETKTPAAAAAKTEKKKDEPQTPAVAPKSAKKRTNTEVSEPSSSDSAEPSTRVMRKRISIEKPPVSSDSSVENSKKKKVAPKASTPAADASEENHDEQKKVAKGQKEEKKESPVPVTVTIFERRSEPPQTIFSVGEMAKKLLAQLDEKQTLTKRKLKKEFCIACLDFKLASGNCSRDHDENDDRIQKQWKQLYPTDRILSKQIIHDDLTKIAQDWF